MALNHGPGAKGAVSSPPSKIKERLSHRFTRGLSSLLTLVRGGTSRIASQSRSPLEKVLLSRSEAALARWLDSEILTK